MTTNAEFDWETKGSKLTPRQRADFSEVVDNWLTGAVPLAEAAAALRARIAKLPSNRPVRAPRVAKPKATPAAE